MSKDTVSEAIMTHLTQKCSPQCTLRSSVLTLSDDYKVGGVWWRPASWLQPFMCDGVKELKVSAQHALEIELCHLAFEAGADQMYQALRDGGHLKK